MNSQLVINLARKGKGFKGWYMQHTLGGKLLLKKALANKYGTREVLGDGTLKYTKQNGSSTEVRYMDKKTYKPYRTTVRTYDAAGKRIALNSYYQSRDDIEHRTCLNVMDYPGMGRKSVFKRMSYNKDTLSWDTDYAETTSIKRSFEGLKIVRKISDYINQTAETIDKFLPLE